MSEKEDSNTTHTNRATIPTRRKILKLTAGAGVGALSFPGLAAADDTSADSEDAKAENSDWVTEDEETPDWYTIGPDDEVAHKPKEGGAIQQDGLTSQSSERCLGGTLGVGFASVDVDICHAGGCRWSIRVSAAGQTAESGFNNSCQREDNFSSNLRPVSIDITAEPRPISPTTTVLTFVSLEGEICAGSVCRQVDFGLNF